jgi:hypothetical protein
MISSPMNIHGRNGSNGTSRRKSECATKYPVAVKGANREYSMMFLSKTPLPSNRIICASKSDSANIGPQSRAAGLCTGSLKLKESGGG